jgi:hypothetical protein
MGAKTYHQKRKNYSHMLKPLETKGITVIEFNNQSQVDDYLKRR